VRQRLRLQRESTAKSRDESILFFAVFSLFGAEYKNVWEITLRRVKMKYSQNLSFRKE
jgi:hypothetical protein